MQIVNANEWPEEVKTKSIFLAGPTPREENVCSWRPEAIGLLKEAGFDGAVFVPETPDGEWQHSYMNQIEWEHYFLDSCSAILMWVPRELVHMPAFTTNIEFGFYVRSLRLFYGRPEDTPKTTYMDYCYRKFARSYPYPYLSSLVEATVRHVNWRRGVE